jgi:hypothetical protein
MESRASYVVARAERAVTKGLPSVLKDPRKARAIIDSGGASGKYAAALVDANRAGRTMGPRGDSAYFRGKKRGDLYRARARIKGSPENAERLARVRNAPSGDHEPLGAYPVIRRRREAARNTPPFNIDAPGVRYKGAPAKGSRNNTFNPRSRG